MQLGLTLRNTYFWAVKSCCCHVIPVSWTGEQTLSRDNNLISVAGWFYSECILKKAAILLAKSFTPTSKD